MLTYVLAEMRINASNVVSYLVSYMIPYPYGTRSGITYVPYMVPFVEVPQSQIKLKACYKHMLHITGARGAGYMGDNGVYVYVYHNICICICRRVG